MRSTDTDGSTRPLSDARTSQPGSSRSRYAVINVEVIAVDAGGQKVRLLSVGGLLPGRDARIGILSWAAPMCLIINGAYNNSTKKVVRHSYKNHRPQRKSTNQRKMRHARRHCCPVIETSRIPRVMRRPALQFGDLHRGGNRAGHTEASCVNRIANWRRFSSDKCHPGGP